MKKSNFSVMLAAVAAVFVLSAQAQAYSVSGNVANPGRSEERRVGKEC